MLHTVTAATMVLEILFWLYPHIGLMLVMYAGTAYLLDYGYWKNGVDAIRYIDPSWDEQTEGILYPSILKERGLVRGTGQSKLSKVCSDVIFQL